MTAVSHLGWDRGLLQRVKKANGPYRQNSGDLGIPWRIDSKVRGAYKELTGIIPTGRCPQIKASHWWARRAVIFDDGGNLLNRIWIGCKVTQLFPWCFLKPGSTVTSNKNTVRGWVRRLISEAKPGKSRLPLHHAKENSPAPILRDTGWKDLSQGSQTPNATSTICPQEFQGGYSPGSREQQQGASTWSNPVRSSLQRKQPQTKQKSVWSSFGVSCR